jgi:predicted XRE-type DNA-binding protein
VKTEFDSVWEALGFSAKEAANLEARSSLIRQISKIIEKKRWTQADAARHCKISQPRMSNLLAGQISKFSIDALLRIGGSLGYRVKVTMVAG